MAELNLTELVSEHRVKIGSTQSDDTPPISCIIYVKGGRVIKVRGPHDWKVRMYHRPFELIQLLGSNGATSNIDAGKLLSYTQDDQYSQRYSITQGAQGMRYGDIATQLGMDCAAVYRTVEKLETLTQLVVRLSPHNSRDISRQGKLNLREVVLTRTGTDLYRKMCEVISTLKPQEQSGAIAPQVPPYDQFTS